MIQKASLLKDGAPLPEQLSATDAHLTGSVRYLLDFVIGKLNLSSAQQQLIRPGFETLDAAISDKLDDWNGIFLHVMDELQKKGVELEQREALLSRMRRDGRTFLYRREFGEERLLGTLCEEHRGNGFGILMADHDRFKLYNDTFGHALGDLVLSTTGRLFRMHREGDIGVRWGGDEYLRIVPNLTTPTQLERIARRDAELVDSFDWEGLDERLGRHPPRLSIGFVYCERPSRDERGRMLELDAEAGVTQEQRFDLSMAVPPGSSSDLARRLVGLADALMYKAKQTPTRAHDPRFAHVNVRIVNGKLTET